MILSIPVIKFDDSIKQYHLNYTLVSGYEITDPGTPMMVKYNDGWYSKSQLGSRLSLTSNKSKKGEMGSKPMSAKASSSNLLDAGTYTQIQVK